MGEIAVVLASSQYFRNSGMFSVDLAAFNFFKLNFPGYKLKFYVFHLNDREDYPNENFIPYDTYNVITHENVKDIYKSDLIVYWSDLMHTRAFFEGYMIPHVFKEATDVDLFFKAFFLEDAPDKIFQKTIMFGGSMLPFTINEFGIGDRHIANLKRFYSKVSLAMPRDEISFKNLGFIAGDNHRNIMPGCDPAFLLSQKNSFKEGFLTSKTNKIGLFVGRRTKIKFTDLLKIFIFATGKKKEIEWIPWMVNRESFLERGLKNPGQAINLFLHVVLEKLFKNKTRRHIATSLGEYDMIITDTYHLAINAIKENVPAFCIHDGKELYKGSDKIHGIGEKRDILYRMLDMPMSHGKITGEKLYSTYYNSSFNGSKYEQNVLGIYQTLINKCRKILSPGVDEHVSD